MDVAAVAQEDVGAVAGGDPVVADSADHHIGAVAGLDGVVAAQVGLGGDDVMEVRRAHGIVGQGAVVPQQGVRAVASNDLIVAHAAGHDVGAVAQGDGIVTASSCSSIAGSQNYYLAESVKGQATVVADNDVADIGAAQ